MDIATALGLLLMAISVGIYGSIIGAGGGFLVVAGLVVIFDLSGATTVGTSVITTLFIHVTGALNYNRKGLVDRPTAAWFSVGAVPVAFLSAAFLAKRIPQQVFEVVIGLLLLALAVFVVARPSTQRCGGPTSPTSTEQTHRQRSDSRSTFRCVWSCRRFDHGATPGLAPETAHPPCHGNNHGDRCCLGIVVGNRSRDRR